MKNKNNINYEDEGVFYTPSEEAQGEFSFDNSFSEKSSKNLKTPKKLPPQKSKYPMFMTLAIGSGILVFITLFVIMHNVFNSNDDNTSDYVVSQTTYSYENASEDIPEVGQEYFGLVRFKSEISDILTIYNISKDENADYTITGGTKMYDEYGKSIVLGEISEGDLITFVYDSENSLTSIKKSNKGFEETLNNGFKINFDDMTISSGMKTYSYSEMTKFTYRDSEFDPTLLDPTIDIITISGYNDKIWAVNLKKGHSEIEIIKNDKIKNGIIEVDTNVYKKLSDAETIKLNEGFHKIVVKGENIDSFTKEIALAVNEKYTLNLSEIKIKTGKVSIIPNVTDYALYINGALELSREPLNLEYGTYSIEIVKYGYVTYSTKFTVDSPQKTINAQLKKEVKMGTLTVNSNPTGANLSIDGMAVGTTPYSSDLVQGQHSITLKKEGYKDITIGSIYISDQETIYNVDLQKE